MRSRLGLCVRLAVIGAVVAALAGCAGSDSGSSSATSAVPSSPGAGTKAVTRHRPGHRRAPPHSAAVPHHARTASGAALVVSTASGVAVQPQPDPGSCHAHGSGLYSRPDPACTPGALNPAVTQATIQQTICVSGWTATVRPAESVTEPEKLASMAAYGDSGSPHDYEYDHLVPLELGGALNDARNLWPEPGASPNPKDAIENSLRSMVCAGEMPLGQAQRIMATGWVAWAQGHGGETGGSGAPAGQPGPAPAPGPSPSRSPSPPSSGPNKPISEVNCSDFSTHAQAQSWFEQHGGSPSNDVAGLDRDHDGLACESLP